MIDFPVVLQTILTLGTLGIGVGISLAIIFVAFRSKLPGQTIKDLQDSNKAKDELIKDIRNELDVVKAEVLDLKAENKIIRALPLNEIKETQQKILELLKTQNEILTKMSLTPAVQVNNK